MEESISLKYKTHYLKQVVSIKNQHVFQKKKKSQFHSPIYKFQQLLPPSLRLLESSHYLCYWMDQDQMRKVIE